MSNRAKAIEYLQKSGVVNTKMTLGEMLEHSAKLEEISPGDLAAWTFVSPDYVYTGSEVEKDKPQIVRP
ncbi:hypothetical protein CKO11_05455 [Rhodobacter sp. TJ_12]|uniref:hypothetical protein n=1 Tax=Rhodobacter sp. TJ_12 TaxID=2029399 RepID=UPI001CBB60F5|nr:hypothetical protein [Rhodobacter sp. TJ_12]MBZ4021905.1 hypothetical protein [Rhodobacter sp. TJ_12]